MTVLRFLAEWWASAVFSTCQCITASQQLQPWGNNASQDGCELVSDGQRWGWPQSTVIVVILEPPLSRLLLVSFYRLRFSAEWTRRLHTLSSFNVIHNISFAYVVIDNGHPLCVRLTRPRGCAAALKKGTCWALKSTQTGAFSCLANAAGNLCSPYWWHAFISGL